MVFYCGIILLWNEFCVVYGGNYKIPIVGGIINILIMISAIWVLKEKMTINMIVGAIIIILGIVIMNIKR